MTRRKSLFPIQVLLFIAVLLLAACPKPATAQIEPSKLPSFSQVECGLSAGTATRINDTSYITAFHVVSDNCVPRINGKSVFVTRMNETIDIALLGVDPVNTEIDCKAMVVYGAASGYAYGNDTFISSSVVPLTNVAILSLFIEQNPEHDFKISKVSKATVLRGMSGGPVLDITTDKVSGMITGTSTDRTLLLYVPGDVICNFLNMPVTQ